MVNISPIFWDRAGETRHGFLKLLHDILKPAVYLEIGVQSGASLTLAEHSKVAVGIDPKPELTTGLPPWATVYESTSDEFFALNPLPLKINLGFIDGMHLWEYALRDFMNIEASSASGGMIVFDDLLPYNQEIATRKQPPGDWTGDVWKVWDILTVWRPDLDICLVDVSPTGLMLVQNLDPGNRRLKKVWPTVNEQWGTHHWDVPRELIDRTVAVSPSRAIDWIKGEST